jgi:gag-pre-integrase-like protein
MIDSSIFHVYDKDVHKLDLWHNRLCHVNYDKMIYMGKLDIIPMFVVDEQKRSTCMSNKITRNPFR